MSVSSTSAIDAERRRLFQRNRSLRYLLFIVASYHTLLDALKLDAYNSALLDHFLPATSRSVKNVSSILVINEISLALLQMCVIGLLEQLALPSIWCVINLAVSSVGWVFFDSPQPSVVSLGVLFLLRALNVRYSMMVHCFGPNYYKHTVAVQFFIHVLPHLVKLPLLRLVPEIVFAHQLPMLYVALVLHGLLFCGLLYGQRHSDERERASGHSDEDECGSAPQSSDRHKRLSWLCNIACSLFLAGVYFDFPMMIAYAHLELGYDLVYDMVYVHLCLFLTVFTVNLVYNATKRIYRRYLAAQQCDRHTRLRRLVAFRMYCVGISYVGCFVSRLLFLVLQLQPSDRAWLPLTRNVWFAVTLCLAGLGGNVQPLLAEFMFRQRASSINWHEYLRCNTRIDFGTVAVHNDDFCERHADQLFKWMYVDGYRVIDAVLLAVWLLVGTHIGTWWYTANALTMVGLSGALFLCYYYQSGRFVRTR